MPLTTAQILHYYYSGGGGLIEFLGISGVPTEALAASGAGDESLHIRPCTVFEFDSNTWGLLYMARSTTKREGLKYATAPKSDPHNWTKEGSLIVASGTLGQWDQEIGGGDVFKSGGTWYIIYDSITTGKLGLASGTSLTSLTKHGSNPIMDNTGETSFKKYLRHPTTYLLGSTVYCFYDARSDAANSTLLSKIGYATADISDLTTWNHAGAPIYDMSLHTWGSNNTQPHIQKFGNFYYMICGSINTTADLSHTQGGGLFLLYSEDLINWTPVTTNVWLNYEFPQCSWYGHDSFQEYVLFYDGTNYNIYFWGENQNIGRFVLQTGAFDNQLPSFSASDGFTDNSISADWTVIQQNGITVSETGGKIVCVADGVGTEAGFPRVIEHSQVMNTGEVINLVFTPTMANLAGVDGWFIELTDATNQNRILIQRQGVANRIRFRVFVGGVAIHDAQNLVYNSGQALKMTLNQCDTVILWKDNGSGSFAILSEKTDSGIGTVDLKFCVKMNNSVGNGNTITIDNWSLWKYDHPLQSNFVIP